MIYLFDDKILRQQNDYNWPKEKFDLFSNHIKTIYKFKDCNIEEIFKEDNVILYHESFVDSTSDYYDAVNIRNEFEIKARENNAYLVFFSGSMSNRQMDYRVASLPVSVLYKNLEIFIKKSIEEDLDIKYLLFGLNYDLEEKLSNNLDTALISANREIEFKNNSKIIFFRPDDRYLTTPFEGGKEIVLFDDLSGADISQIINENLNKDVFDGIFVPVSYGPVLSDFSGLQLAAHIRCSRSKNQFSRIFIYSYADIADIVNADYYNILHTKNIFLVDFSKKAFAKALSSPHYSFDESDLRLEMKKLKLDRPDHYYDDHSVANEWGLFQMIRNANVNISQLDGFDISKFDSLYFKWLMTINGLYDPLPEEQIESQKRYAPIITGPKILGKIELPKNGRK
jgi:hypothetical protein